MTLDWRERPRETYKIFARQWKELTEYWLTCSAALILSRSFCNNNSSTVHYALINTLTTMTSKTNGSLHQEFICFTATLSRPIWRQPCHIDYVEAEKLNMCDWAIVLLYFLSDGTTSKGNC